MLVYRTFNIPTWGFPWCLACGQSWRSPGCRARRRSSPRPGAGRPRCACTSRRARRAPADASPPCPRASWSACWWQRTRCPSARSRFWRAANLRHWTSCTNTGTVQNIVLSHRETPLGDRCCNLFTVSATSSVADPGCSVYPGYGFSIPDPGSNGTARIRISNTELRKNFLT